MAQKVKQDRKAAAEKLGKMLKTFGDTISEILGDPAVKEKAKEFSQSVVDAAAKVVGSKIKDAEVKAKFRNVGKAAQDLGKSVEKHFETVKTK